MGPRATNPSLRAPVGHHGFIVGSTCLSFSMRLRTLSLFVTSLRLLPRFFEDLFDVETPVWVSQLSLSESGSFFTSFISMPSFLLVVLRLCFLAIAMCQCEADGRTKNV